MAVGGEATAALNLANQKSWILFFQKPLRTDISNNVYFDFDTNYFKVGEDFLGFYKVTGI